MNRPKIIVIGLTFLRSNHTHSNVKPNGAIPGSSASNVPCNVVTVSVETLKPDWISETMLRSISPDKSPSFTASATTPKFT